MSDIPLANEKIDYLFLAKYFETNTDFQTPGYSTRSMAASLIFIGEQLARIAEVLEDKADYESLLTNARIYGAGDSK